ncbi:Ig-like domain-containing protein, partial [Methanobrevibacter sp. UBA212]|uniref:Ig-like domain-containing protein n=1 Tax=Methanobrevibacter sp. UBA212 TaxID=1915476 RepID=UPI0025E8AD8F
KYFVNLTGGAGQLSVTGLTNGTHDVKVTYLENDKYLSSVNDTAKIVVSKVASEVTVKFDNITAGEIAVLNITVTDGATGNVTVKVGDETYTVGLVSGKAQLLVPNLKVGEYDITATYNGDTKYVSDVATAKLNVGKAKLSPDDVVVEDLGNGTVKVTVPENATGNVTVKVGDNTYVVNITNGTAYINLGNETPGAHEVSVIYSGDGNYSNITVTKVVTIPKNPTPIIIEVNNTVVGNVTRIVVTVPENVTDIVTIEIDGKKYNKTAVDGKAVFEIEGLTAGVKTVVATYAGDDSYLSNGTTEQFNVTKRASNVNVTGDEIKVGEDAIIKITGPSGYDGIALVDSNTL